MAAKQIAFDQEAREAMRRGIGKLARAVKVEGTEYLVMREDDIMGVVAK